MNTVTDADFGFEIPTSCPDVPAEILIPRNTWEEKEQYDSTKQKLIDLFRKNFRQFEAKVNPKIVEAGPQSVKAVG